MYGELVDILMVLSDTRIEEVEEEREETDFAVEG